ncbi:MAG TPA: short-chain dehydrogenase, partial [Sulfitobacter sp.]|nr:short-chain dehydrogenase [Sulfitobacter sp.]
MKDWQGKTYWLVGASDGLGAALAHQLSRTGAEVILSARSEDKLTELAKALPGRARVRVLDVTDEADVAAAAQEI